MTFAHVYTMKYKNEENTSETHKLYTIKKRSNNKVSFVELFWILSPW